MKKSRNTITPALAAASLAGLSLLAGCITSHNVDRSVRPSAADGSITFDQHQHNANSDNPQTFIIGSGTRSDPGTAWSAVLGGGYVGGTAQYSGDALHWRNDDNIIGQQRSGPLLATSQWPQPERPSVRIRTRVNIPRNADTLLFFSRPSERRGPHWVYPHNWSH